VLTLTELTFRRGERVILGPLNAQLPAGEMIGVVGPNGSGKSTLLRLLYGYLIPSGGTLHLDDQPLEQIEPRQLAQKLGACPQEGEPSLDFSVEQALALAAGGDRAVTAQRVERFPFLGLQDLYGRLLSQLSGGEKQRIRLGRALLSEPPWLVLDEPANHLDLATGWSLLSYLRQPRAGGVVVALHDLANACRFCHRLLVLDRGRMVALAPPIEALTPETLEQVFGLRGQVQRHDGQSLLEIQGVTRP
jgi:iron complex transport system ATP-binding protein